MCVCAHLTLAIFAHTSTHNAAGVPSLGKSLGKWAWSGVGLALILQVRGGMEGGGVRLRVRLGFSGHGLGWSLSFCFRCVNTFRTTGTPMRRRRRSSLESSYEMRRRTSLLSCSALPD
jgi:hypothetical protein